MPVEKIGYRTVFVNDTFILNFVPNSIWTVTVSNSEGEGTGSDGGGGVNVSYIDENGNKVSERVPNNGSLTFTCRADGFNLCTVSAVWLPDAGLFGDYEDKIVEVSATSAGESLSFNAVHIGDNTSDAVLSYTFSLPDVFSEVLSGTVTIDWGDGTTDSATVYLSCDTQFSSARWCEVSYDSFSGIALIRVLKSHTYSSGGTYTITITYALNDFHKISTYSAIIDVPPWTSDEEIPNEPDDTPPPDPGIDNPGIDDTYIDPTEPNPSELLPPFITPVPIDPTEPISSPYLNIVDVSTDKDVYSWRVDRTAKISFRVTDQNSVPVDGCVISPPAQNLGNGMYDITYSLPQVEDNITVNISAQKTGYEQAEASVFLNVSEWGNYILSASVLTDKDKYLYASTVPAKITVIVEDKSGNRVSGCSVTDNFGNTYADTGNGEYIANMDISNLPIGRYDIVVKVEKENYKDNIQDFNTVLETFTYDGVTNSFKLKYKLINPISVKINGTETTSYTISNDMYGDCYLTINDTLSASDQIEISYYPYTDSTYFDIAESLEPITVIVVDEESIRKYGKRPMETLYIPSLRSVEEAEQIGKDYLSIYSKPRPVFEIETFLEGFPPKIGDVIYTNDKYWNLFKKRINYIEYSLSAKEHKLRIGLEYEKEILIMLLENLRG